MTLAERWDRWRRRLFGRYSIDDPRPIAEGAPYTFFLPSENELLALSPGDHVKLLFRGNPGGKSFDVERMWVSLTDVNGNSLTGRLDNVPYELHQLRPDDVIHFHRDQVISIRWDDLRAQQPPSSPPYREYWDRCMVDRCVVDDGVPVYYLYREEDDLAGPEDEFPDSGWRIRGDYRGLTDEELAEWKADYIAIGKVLNSDDSWLPLIDEPVGSAFIRDEETGAFVPTDYRIDDAEE
jgi:hypothetical protein